MTAMDSKALSWAIRADTILADSCRPPHWPNPRAQLLQSGGMAAVVTATFCRIQKTVVQGSCSRTGLQGA
jgi:hypothetical protein